MRSTSPQGAPFFDPAKRRGAKKKLLILLLTAAIVLGAALAVLAVRALREQERLLEEQNRLENRTPLGELTTSAPIVGTNGYRLLADGKGNGLGFFYFGDEALYGRGMADVPAYNTEDSFRAMLTGALRLTYGNGIRGSVIKEVQTYSLAYAADVFVRGGEVNGASLIAVLVPSDAIAAAGAAAAEGSYSFAEELEAAIRKMRTASPHCDILIAVPYGTSSEVAEAVLALAEHYQLIAVDLRTLSLEGDVLHTDGPNAGYPTAQGHTAYAEALKAALDAAVAARYTSPEMPEPLYENQ